MKAALSLLTLVALGMTACAPTQAGSQSYTPVVHTTPNEITAVAPGQTVYTQYTYSGDVLGIADARFEALDINFSAAQYSDQVVGPEAEAAWLRLSASGLPAGVQVSLVRATIARPISRTNVSGGSVRVTYTEVVRVLLKVTAATTARPGQSAALLTFSDGAGTGTVPLRLNVTR